MARGNDRGVQIRIGISSGEATQTDNDLFGPPVVEASRLCAAATPGQILVSDVVRLLARGKGHTFTQLGELTLKGLPEPVAASEVRWEPLATGVPLPPRLAAPPALAMFGRDAESAAIAFPLLTDRGGSVARLFRACVQLPLRPMYLRTVYLVNPERKIRLGNRGAPSVAAIVRSVEALQQASKTKM